MASEKAAVRRVLKKATQILRDKEWTTGTYIKTSVGQLSFDRRTGDLSGYTKVPSLTRQERAEALLKTGQDPGDRAAHKLVRLSGTKAEDAVAEVCAIGAVEVAISALGESPTLLDSVAAILDQAIHAKEGDLLETQFENAWQCVLDDGYIDEIVPDKWFEQFLRTTLKPQDKAKALNWLRYGLRESYENQPQADEVYPLLTAKEVKQIIADYSLGGDATEAVIEWNDREAQDKAEVVGVFERAVNLAK